MKRKSLKIAMVLPIFVAIVILVKFMFQANFYRKEVSELFLISGDNPDRKFSYEQLEGLPEPVQKYFKHVLKEGQFYINYVRLTHDGLFKTATDKDWIKIKGEQYFTTEKPGFIWLGKTTMFTAKDSYIEGKGKLTVSLLSLVNIVKSHGDKINQGELLRWLGESVWFPTNLLPNKNLQWSAIDSSHAKLTYSYKNLVVHYIVSFNDKDEITQMKTERYMDESLETWVGKFMNYKIINNVVIPTEIEAIWKLKSGDYSYARFNIKKIEYENPIIFK